MEKDPFLNFISDLSEKIKVSREHKQIMERVNTPGSSADESKASLENLILTIKEKIENTVVKKTVSPVLSTTHVLPVTSSFVKVVSEEENNFTEFVDKLKNILSKPRTVDTLKTETTSTSGAPALSGSKTTSLSSEDTTKKYVTGLDKPKEKNNKTKKYVTELEKVKDAVQIEKEDTKVTEIKKLIEEYADKYIKKALIMSEYAGGGGTNAVQYAEGGTMDGDLNVNGNYLSGGINLLDIFALQPDLDNQTLSYNESNYNLSISNGNTVNLSSINTVTNANSASWDSVYTTVKSLSDSWEESASITPLQTASASWNSAYTTTNTNSGKWESNYTSFNTNSAKYDSVYTTTNSNSAKWESNYTSFNTNSAKYDSNYTLVNTNSAYWEAAIQAVNGTANQIVATNTGNNNHNNQVTLSLAQSAVFPGDVLIPGTLTVTGTATYINTKNLIVDDPIIFLANNNTSNIVDTGFVSHFKLGPPLNNTHTGLIRRANQGVPGYWTLFSGLTTEPLTAVNIDWSDPNVKLDTLSANIATNNGTSDNWNSVYTSFNTNSAKYDSNFTTTNSNSAKWESNYTSFNTNSAKYDSVYTTTNTNSGKWESNYTSFNTNSAKYDSVYTSFNTNSGNYDSVYTTVKSLSDSWEESASITPLQTASASWNSVYTTTNNNSASWSEAYTNLATFSAAYLSGYVDNRYFYKDSNFTANPNTRYSTGTLAGPITATLPSGAVIGDSVEFFDADGMWDLYSLIVDNNGYKIETYTDKLSCNVKYGIFKLIYTDINYGWRIIPMPRHSDPTTMIAFIP